MLSKITTGYQITIPSFFRKLTDIQIGDYIELKNEGSKLIIEPLNIRNNKEALVKFNDIFQEEIKDEFFNNLSEDKIMNIVNKEIKNSRNDENGN
jgi:AbrB family looped-hinge helix DNA binding protein